MKKKLKFNFYALILIILIGVTYIFNEKLTSESQVIHELTIPKIENKKIIKYTTPLFIPNSNFSKFTTVDITLSENLKSTESILKEIMNNLIINLENKKIIPKKLYEYEIYLDNRILYLDLDSKILTNLKSTREELMIIYSFINSLLAPGGSDEVVILIDGKSLKNLNFITLAKSYKMNTTI